MHVPFCASRCDYCDFATFAGLEELMPRYVAALERHLEPAEQRKLWQTIPPVLDWAIFEATWQGNSREACAASIESDEVILTRRRLERDLEGAPLGHAEAETMLIAAFADEAIAEIADEGMADLMRKEVARWMAARR